MCSDCDRLRAIHAELLEAFRELTDTFAMTRLLMEDAKTRTVATLIVNEARRLLDKARI